MNIEVPVETEARQILNAQAAQMEKLEKLTEAVNQMGANLQWIIERAGGIFEMFASPQMMAMVGQMMSGGIPGMENNNG